MICRRVRALTLGESYTVTIDPSTATALDGFVPTQTGQGTPETDSSTGSRRVGGDLVNDGDRDPTLDFGFVPGSVSVGDFVFIDENRDGIQDAWRHAGRSVRIDENRDASKMPATHPRMRP